ncbi:MAG: CRTAC1 family protein [Archangium sp.]|nr:CRTAC1 family protein [Archangium sp.]
MMLRLVVVCVAVVGCTKTEPEPVDGGPDDAGNPDVIPALTDAVTCTEAPAVDAGRRFIDATESWDLGKAGLNVLGNRLAVADLDHDGYPDLVVHSLATNQRQGIDAGVKLVYQLMNRPIPGTARRHFVPETEAGLFQVRGGSDTQYRSAQFAIFGDVDNDGDLDAFSATYHGSTLVDTGDRSELLLNDGAGHFSLVTPADVGAVDKPLPTTGAAFSDVDRDGKLDLYVGYYYAPNSYSGYQARLFRGAGDGHFSDGTGPANLTTTESGYAAFTNHRPSYGITACDLNDDGAPELMVTAYGRQSNLLHVNNGLGVFDEVGRASGFGGDDNVTYADNENFKCFCVQFPSKPQCAGVGPPAIQCPTPAGASWNEGADDQPWRANGNGFTTWCGDVNGDGKNDLYTAMIHHWWAGVGSDSSELLLNATTDASPTFSRLSNATTGMVWPHVTRDWNEGGINAAGGDLDNDGRLDVVVGASDYPDQYSLVFRQKGDVSFEEVAAAWGVKHPCAAGLAVADFDRDGDLDLVVGSSTARDCRMSWSSREVHLYENVAPAGAWLELRLQGNGTTANRSAVGAKVTVKAQGRTFTREVSGGYGHFGMQNDLVLHVGLAGCTGADEVTVRWPDATGTTQTFRNVPANTLVELRQGDERVFKVLR